MTKAVEDKLEKQLGRAKKEAKRYRQRLKKAKQVIINNCKHKKRGVMGFKCKHKGIRNMKCEIANIDKCPLINLIRE